jgi:hypothetical protein
MSIRELASRLRQSLSRRNQAEAQHFFALGLAESPDEMLFQTRIQGCFRASKDDFRIEAINTLITPFLKGPQDKLPADWMRYLESVKALLHVAATVRGVYRTILADTKHDGCRRLKEMLAQVEITWLARSSNLDTQDGLVALAGNNFPEQLAECFSFYAYHTLRDQQLRDCDLGVFDEGQILRGESSAFLTKVVPILKFQKAELLVDHFGYIAVRDKSVVTVIPPNEDFEKSLRFSFASSEIAEANLALRVLRQYGDAKSLSSYAEQLFKMLGSKLVHLKLNPERIVVFIPDIAELTDLITSDLYFQEELYSVELAKKEFHIDHEVFCSQPVFKSVTLLDVLRFQRIFCFLQAGIVAYLKAHNQHSAAVVVRSLVPVMSLDQLRQIVERFMSAPKATDLVELLTRTPGQPGIFDIQYQPIIRAESLCMVPFNLIAQSNLVRNVLVVSKFRFDAKTETDPVTESLARTLSDQGFAVTKNFNYSHNGSAGEVDILAARDGVFFAFECKGSIHPASTAELRTSYDYVEKAVAQLDRFMAAIKDKEFFLLFTKKLNWGGLSQDLAFSCIVMGNRMFTGYHRGTHAVRPLYSLASFIRSGELAYQDQIVNLWEGKSIHARDLVAYIEKNVMHDPLLKLMKPCEHTYQVGGKMLVFPSFALDVTELGQK